MELRIRKVDEGGGGLTGTQASEAKGPFPGGKRVGSWGKKKKKRTKKAKGEHQRIYIRRSIRIGRLKGMVGGLKTATVVNL